MGIGGPSCAARDSDTVGFISGADGASNSHDFLFAARCRRSGAGSGHQKLAAIILQELFRFTAVSDKLSGGAILLYRGRFCWNQDLLLRHLPLEFTLSPYQRNQSLRQTCIIWQDAGITIASGQVTELRGHIPNPLTKEFIYELSSILRTIDK